MNIVGKNTARIKSTNVIKTKIVKELLNFVQEGAILMERQITTTGKLFLSV